MIERILNSECFPSSFNIEKEKKKFINSGGVLPPFFIDINEIDKNYLLKLISSRKHTKTEELLAILFWGIYFTVLSRNPKTIESLINFIKQKGFEDFMKKAVSEIVKSSSPQELFKNFTIKDEFKIPGIGYAYFTKLFFFYREALAPEKQTYLVLDKWLSNAWCAIDGSININTQVFDKYYSNAFNGSLSKQKDFAYDVYITFMENLAAKNNLNVIQLEEKLFGVDLRISKKNNNYNPRNEYISWAQNNGIKLKDDNKSSGGSDAKNQTVKKTNIEDIKATYSLRLTKNYKGIYFDNKQNSKIGYVDFDGWLNASEDLKGIISSSQLKWEEGNTKGGSREKWKFKFKTTEECIEFLRSKGVLKDT
jgi:hypothetical protein